MAISFGGGISIGGGITITAPSAAVVNGSATFNGSTQYLTLPNSSVPVNLSTGDFTAECWFVTTSASTAQTLFWLGGNTNAYATVRLAIDTSGLILYVSVDGASWAIISGVIGTVASNTWNHVAVTRSGSTFKVYLNGTQVGTNYTQAGTLYAGTLNYIGALNYSAIVSNPYRQLNGYISNARIVKGVVVYTTTFTPATGPLTSTQSADQNGIPSAAITGTSTGVLLNTYYGASFLADASTNNLTVTNVASVTSSTLSPFTPTTPGSVLFNGTNQVLTIPDNAVFEMSGDFTLEAWFYMTASPTDQGDIITKGASGNFQPYSVYVNASNAITLKSSSTGLAWDVANAVTFGTVTLNTWNHVAVSRSGTAMRLFLNGTLNATITNGLALYNNAFPVGIGARSDATELFTGYISNARIVKGVAVYTSAFTPSTVPLTSTQSANVNGTPSAAITGTSTSLLLNTVTGLEYLKDSSSNNFTVTNVGSATGNALDPF